MNDHEVIDRYGKRVSRNGVLQDGDHMVVKMNMMDGSNPSLVAAAALAEAVKRNEQFDARGHRPGFMVVDSTRTVPADVPLKVLRDGAEQAREERDKRLLDAWKTPTTTDATAVEKVAVLGADAPKDVLFAARDQAVTERDRRLEAAWKSS